ncbi:MAG: glycosyltransferase family 2 protein [Thermoflavifilum sp.]|nr:glycosyltransferase family 2 protein [Thermoflavifilum sp.]
MLLSVVITVMNEEENIPPLIKSLHEALQGLNYEIIFVDDGSTDGTVKQIQALLDEHIRVLVLKRNYGQTVAMEAGIQQATGDYIVTIDGDLQNDPADIPLLLQIAQTEGWEVVAGRRANRQDNWLLRKLPSKIANWFIRQMTGVRLHDYGCTLKLFTREIAKNLGLYGEMHRFIPVLAAMQGARMTEVAVKHHPRKHGYSKYGLGRTFKVMSDLLLVVFFQKYFRSPMHFFGPIGMLVFVAGLIINLYLFILKISGEKIGERPLLILGVILLLSGLLIIIFGFLMEVMMRIYYGAHPERKYQIRQIITATSKSSSSFGSV